MNTRASAALAIFLACLMGVGLSVRSAWGQMRGPLAVFIVSDPHQPRSVAVERGLSSTLHRLREDAAVEPLRLPIQVYHLGSRADVDFVRTHFGVSRAQVPFVGLAVVDADGLPTRFVQRYASVTDADVAARSVFAQAMDTMRLSARQGVEDVPTPTPSATVQAVETPPGGMPPLADENVWPPGAAMEIVTQPDGADMVLVPGGPFYMGSNRIDDEMPVHTVNVAPFYIDRFEVSNRQFARFVAATHYVTDAERKGFSIVFTAGNPAIVRGADWRQPSGPGSAIQAYPDYPVVNVSWNDAEAYCQWAGKRLPSEQEWEKAARGVDARDYPWGDGVDESRTNSRYLNKGDIRRTAENLDYGHGPVAIGSLPAGASPYGVMDMLGNVAEWVEDWYHPYPGNTRPVGDGEGAHKVLRGGGWNDDQMWTAWRAHQWPEQCSNQTGFRTCRDLVVPVPAVPPAP